MSLILSAVLPMTDLLRIAGDALSRIAIGNLLHIAVAKRSAAGPLRAAGGGRRAAGGGRRAALRQQCS
jgi:hypothetical protein